MSCSTSQAERENSRFLCFFCSIQALSGLDGGHLHWGGPSDLLGPPIQRLMSSGDTFTFYPEIIFNQMSEHPMIQLIWHIKLVDTVYQFGSIHIFLSHIYSLNKDKNKVITLLDRIYLSNGQPKTF